MIAYIGLRTPGLASQLVFVLAILIPIGMPMYYCWQRFRVELDENGLTLPAVLWLCGFSFFFGAMGLLAWICGLC